MQFLVPGDVGIAEQGTAIPVFVCRTGGEKAVLREEVSLHLLTEGPLPRHLQNTRRDHLTHQLQQVAGQKTVVSRHQQPPYGVTLENFSRLTI